jgi:hypothetical protein
MQEKPTKSTRLYPSTHAELVSLSRSENLERAEVMRRAIIAYIVVKNLRESAFMKPRLEVRA